MTTHDDIRDICRHLPCSVENEERFGFSIQLKDKSRGYCWLWAERIEPKKARVINEAVLAVRTPGLTAKDLLLDSDPIKFFTEPHYNHYPAILVKLNEIEPEELEDLLLEAWRSVAPKSVIMDYDGVVN